MLGKAQQQRLARERIAILFREAAKAGKSGNLKRASRYVFLARKLSMKFSVRFTREQRRKFCHYCYSYLQPGKNVSVKINPKVQAVEYACKECGKINRYPYIREKKSK